MKKIDFLTAGQSEDAAMHFACQLVGKLYLKSIKDNDSRTINFRCADANQAHIVDDLLWKIPKSLFIPHRLVNDKKNKECKVEISYPGIKSDKKYDSLVNLNPQLPSNYLEFQEAYQIVIKDESGLQEKARLSFKKCLKDGIKPTYID